MTDQVAFAPPEDQWMASIQFAQNYQCPGCEAEVLVGLREDGYASVDVYHEETCQVSGEDLAQDSSRQAQVIAEALDQSILLLMTEEAGRP